MSPIQVTHTASSPSPTPTPAAAAAQPRLGTAMLLLLASGAGFAVAALYYAQPMLGVLGTELNAGARAVGLVPTLTQLGYALGILLLAPLGDRFNRKHIILAKVVVLALAMLMSALVPSIHWLLVACLATGLSATLAQDIVPAAATLAPEASRGKAVGTVMTGLLLGVLLSRVVSGLVAEHFGWRTVYAGAAVTIAVIGVALWKGLPDFKATTSLAYGALLASMGKLLRQHSALRRAALSQAILATGFSAFWSTLAVMLHGEPFHLGSAAAGAFGLAGAAGALGAPLAGRLADKRGPELVARLGAGLAAVSFAAMGLGVFMPTQAQLWLIVVSAIGFDLGMQVALIAHQTIVYGIDPGARSRLNAVLFTFMFIGMASGAALGSLALAQWGWMGVVGLATATSLGALAVRLWPRKVQTTA